jgi:hypothetical protein
MADDDGWTKWQNEEGAVVAKPLLDHDVFVLPDMLCLGLQLRHAGDRSEKVVIRLDATVARSIGARLLEGAARLEAQGPPRHLHVGLPRKDKPKPN